VIITHEENVAERAHRILTISDGMIIRDTAAAAVTA